MMPDERRLNTFDVLIVCALLIAAAPITVARVHAGAEGATRSALAFRTDSVEGGFRW